MDNSPVQTRSETFRIGATDAGRVALPADLRPRGRQAVTDAAHGFDALGSGARAPVFLAHIGHVYLERAPVGIRHQPARRVALPAQLQHELGLTVHPVAGLDQAREQVEFAPRQQNGCPIHLHEAPLGVEAQAVVLQPSARQWIGLSRGRRSPQHGVDAGAQLPGAKR